MRLTSEHNQQIICPKFTKKNTNVDYPLGLDSMKEEDPTIRIPKIAIPQPTK